VNVHCNTVQINFCVISAEFCSFLS
jgi:hypothetical protein